MKKIITIDGLSLIVVGIIGALLSLLLYDVLWRLVIVLIGLILLFWGISYLIFTINARNYKQENIVKPAFKSGILIFIGIHLLIPWTSWLIQFLIGLVVGVYLLSTSLVRIYKSEDKKQQFKKDLFKIILSLLVIVLGIQESGKYIAVGFFAFVLIYGIVSYISDKKKMKNGETTKYHKEINDVEYYVDDNQE